MAGTVFRWGREHHDSAPQTGQTLARRRCLVLARTRAASNGHRRGHKKKIPAAAGQSHKERRHQASDTRSLRSTAGAVEPFSLRTLIDSALIALAAWMM
jgi:hypothetical protein